jgi:hypothetical protein
MNIQNPSDDPSQDPTSTPEREKRARRAVRLGKTIHDALRKEGKDGWTWVFLLAPPKGLDVRLGCVLGQGDSEQIISLLQTLVELIEDDPETVQALKLDCVEASDPRTNN